MAIRFRVCVAAAVLLLAIVSTATAKYSGGSGTAQDPYRIAAAADLILLGETPADYDKHFLLTADIDLDPKLPGRKVFDKAVIAPISRVSKAGNYSWEKAPFSGVFDGSGHTISHLTIKGMDFLGLFGQLYSGAEVSNLGVVDVNVTGSGSSVGALVAQNDEGHVTACYSTGMVSGSPRVGGLVGCNSGDVIRSYSTCAVSGGWAIGGLVGENYGEVRRSYSSGVVSGEDAVGGLVGSDYGAVTGCYSTGVVSGNWGVGGLVGAYDGDTIWDCYSLASVAGRHDVGGLIGTISDEIGSLDISRCYSSGPVTGENNVGGLVGFGWPSCVTASFWDIETSGQAKSAGGTGKTTAEMQTPKTIFDAGWDFVGETQNGTSEIWQMPQRGGYPVLAIFSGYTPPRLQGSGTAEAPYLVSNPVELGAMVHYSPDAHYRLTASVDLSGIRWSAPVIPSFAGTFDGSGHTISHLTIKGVSDVALFGYLKPGAEVKDLGVVDVNMTGSGQDIGGLVAENHGGVTHCYSTGVVSGTGQPSYVGGLVGSNPGTVTHCYSAGTVTGTSSVGGLVGSNGLWRMLSSVGGGVTRCYSTAAVSATGQSSRVGGLVGWNASGSVAQCYSTGAVSGIGQLSDVGGLVGDNSGAVTQCYSAGPVKGQGYVGGLVGSGWPGSVTGSFWDTQTSGQATSRGGTGKTTAEMQMASTFLEAGWDFVGETKNGTEDIWWILEGKDYPRLWWEAAKK